MNSKTLKILTAVVAGLVLLLLAVQISDNGDSSGHGQKLLPDFESRANDISRIVIRTADEDGEIRLEMRDDRWVVANADGYPANLAMLRDLTVALAAARIIEDKTANPDQYSKLGVGSPGAGGTGVEVRMFAGETETGVVLGNTARGTFRYARIVGQDQSYLIDQNPQVPDAPDWLQPDVVNIDTDDVRSIVISHADGEQLRLEKADREQGDFDFPNLPDGRDLNYPSVGNSIAGALDNLQLEAVRKAIDEPATTTTVFESWDGIKVTAALSSSGGSEDGSDAEQTWVTFAAEATTDDEEAIDAAAAIQGRLSGWQFQVPAYKSSQLKRRWSDVLRTQDTEE